MFIHYIIMYLLSSRPEILKKLFRVFGSNLKADPKQSYYTEVDPDPTYALTYDNLVKMLAIQMRFRYSMFVCPCNIVLIHTVYYYALTLTG